MTPRPVILDTNVFVAAGFRRASASARLVAAAESGILRLVWHVATLAETRRIVSKIPRLRFDAVAPLFTLEGEFAAPLDLAAVGVVPDPEDRKFAALALATGAPLVSSDDDLLGVRSALSADIWTPGEADSNLLP